MWSWQRRLLSFVPKDFTYLSEHNWFNFFQNVIWAEIETTNHKNNWMAPGKNHVTAISTEILSESTQISRADLCDLKRCSCVVFFLKAGRKDLTNRPEVLFQPPPPPPPTTAPPPNCSFPPEICWIWIHEIWETPCYTAKNRPVCQVFVKFGSILTYLKISVEMAVTWFLPGAIQLLEA